MLFCSLPVLDLESVFCPRSLGFFKWEMVVQENTSWLLGMLIALGVAIVSRPILWIDKIFHEFKLIFPIWIQDFSIFT